MLASQLASRLAVVLGTIGLGFCATAQAQNIDKLTKNAEAFATVGTSDMGYTDSGFALRLGVDAPGLVPMGAFNVGGIAYYTHTGSSYKYSPCSWDYSSNVLSAGPTLNYALPSTKLTFQGRLTGSIGFLSASGHCSSGGSYHADSGTDFDIGLGLGVKYQLNDKFSLRADWDDWGYSTLTVGVGMKF